MTSIQKQVLEMEKSLDLLGNHIECTEEESKAFANSETLPDGVFLDGNNNKYYRLEKFPLSEEDRKDLMYLSALQRTGYLKTIKNCVLFFTIITAIGIAAYLLLLLAH